jgi:very-short-patch-repair endonuclease
VGDKNLLFFFVIFKSMNNNFYNKNLKDFSRELRSEKSTRAEKLLWKSSLSKKQMNVRFLRQRPILNL